MGEHFVLNSDAAFACAGSVPFMAARFDKHVGRHILTGTFLPTNLPVWAATASDRAERRACLPSPHGAQQTMMAEMGDKHYNGYDGWCGWAATLLAGVTPIALLWQPPPTTGIILLTWAGGSKRAASGGVQLFFFFSSLTCGEFSPQFATILLRCISTNY